MAGGGQGLGARRAVTRADRRLGVTAAAGFGAAGVSCGLKPSASPDLALVVGDPGTVAAGVFTTNQVVAAPVVWSRERLAGSADARVVVLNSGNANACTGPAGEAVQATVERAAAELGCRPEQVLVCSTGVIGVPLEMTRVADGIAKAAAALDRSGGQAAAEAILTTDTVAKQAGVRVAGGATVGGMAKGRPCWRRPAARRGGPAGGLPQATMLAVLTTDAVVEPAVLRDALSEGPSPPSTGSRWTGRSRPTTPCCCSPPGRRGRDPTRPTWRRPWAVCSDLAGQMLADAEGGTKVVSVQVGGAGSVAAALAVARRVADSPLVKTAVGAIPTGGGSSRRRGRPGSGSARAWSGWRSPGGRGRPGSGRRPGRSSGSSSSTGAGRPGPTRRPPWPPARSSSGCISVGQGPGPRSGQ